jgi:RND superfamily putative drug exporter
MLTQRIAGWSARHRVITVLGWLLLVAGVYAAGHVAGTANVTAYDPGQSGTAERILTQVAPAQQDAYSESVLIQARGHGETFAGDPAMRQAVSQVVTSLAAQPQYATGIRGPLSPGGQPLVSASGQSALVTFDIPGDVSSVSAAVTADQDAVAAVQARYPGLTVAESGDASIREAVSNSLSFTTAEDTSAPITLILLLAVFGSLVAACIPALLAVSAVTTALGVLQVVSHWLPVTSATYEVVVVVGMAVGVDYSLFYLRRQREERASGRSVPDALRVASRTSGHAVLISGVTVMIAMAGLFLTGDDLFIGMAVGTISVVAISVAGSLTVLPALLALLGPRAEAGRIPVLGRRRAAARPSRLWGALARQVVARPVIWGSAAAVALLALAAPAAGMRLGAPPIDAPRGAPAVQVAEAIQQAFPQAPAPAEIVVTGTDVTGPRVAQAVDALRARTSPVGLVRQPVSATVIGGGRALVVTVHLAGNGTDTASYSALQTLRDQALPATLGMVPGISYAVAGDTAGLYDDIHQTGKALPVVFALVALLAFALLLAAFRSLAIPVVSIALNLLSVAAAYGLVTLVFQDGRLQGPLGYTAFGGIIYWVPLFMFVFLFGISMDYHVFILSRIRELWARGTAPRDAVIDGIASSAGVVSSAALIMVAVFSIFVTLPLIDLKILGVGTAAAVLIDATVIRGILVPAALALLGERAWRLRPTSSAAGSPEDSPRARPEAVGPLLRHAGRW